MTEKQAEELIRKNLEDYLHRMGHFPDHAGRYHCIAPDHKDGNPSMTIEKSGKYAKCWSHPQPRDTFNIFDAINMLEGIRSLHAQKKHAFTLYQIVIDEVATDNAASDRAAVPKTERQPKNGASQVEPAQQEHEPSHAVTPAKNHHVRADVFRPVAEKNEQPSAKPASVNDFVEHLPAIESAADADPVLPTAESRPAAEETPETVDRMTVSAIPAPEISTPIDNPRRDVVPEIVAARAADNFFEIIEFNAIGQDELNPVEDIEAPGEDIEAPGVMQIETEVAAFVAAPEVAAVEPVIEVEAAEPALVEIIEPPIEIIVEFEDVAIANEPEVMAAAPAPVEMIEPTCMADFLSEVLTAYQASTIGLAMQPAIPSGFSELDMLLDGGFFPGLYLFCSRPGEGKTTFALQVADAIAAQGVDVLLISMDLTRVELAAKSISRRSLLMDHTITRNQAKTLRQVLDELSRMTGQQLNQSYLYQVMQAYQLAASHLYILEMETRLSPDDIQHLIERHAAQTANRPVVVLDSMQHLKPAESGQAETAQADASVRSLMQISRAAKTPILALSSVIRDNFGSDVVLSLQLEPAAGTLAAPHRLDVKLLKNRHGAIDGKVSYNYFAAFNYFEEMKADKNK